MRETYWGGGDGGEGVEQEREGTGGGEQSRRQLDVEVRQEVRGYRELEMLQREVWSERGLLERETG